MQKLSKDMPAQLAQIETRAALYEITSWLESASQGLVGRRVRVTRGADKGDVHTILKVALSEGLNGYELVVRVGAGSFQLVSRYVLGVTCELVEEN